MNTSDCEASGKVEFLHERPKNDGIPVELVGFLHRRSDRDQISIGTVANIHLVQGGPATSSGLRLGVRLPIGNRMTI